MTVGCKTGVGGFADGLADGLGRAKGLRAVVSSKKGGAVYSEGVVKKLFDTWSAATRKITEYLVVRGRDAEEMQ